MENKVKRKSGTMTERKNNMIFYILMMAFPVIQFCIFWIGVNGNSILLSFKEYTSDSGFQWVGTQNFINAYNQMSSSGLFLSAIKNSFVAFGITTVITVPLSLLFSYFIYKKMPLSGLFKVILFMPSIISSIIMVILFSYFVERGLADIIGIRLLENIDTRFWTIIFYNIWIGFGINILLYTSSMGSISQEVIEAAKIDGAKPIHEFFYIVIPHIYPTIVTFLVISVAGIFTNQLNLFSFYGSGAESNDLITVGYYLFSQTQKNSTNYYSFPELASYGVLLTIVAVPMTLLVKWALEKFGAKEE